MEGEHCGNADAQLCRSRERGLEDTITDVLIDQVTAAKNGLRTTVSDLFGDAKRDTIGVTGASATPYWAR